MDLQVNGTCVKVFSTAYTSKKDNQQHNKYHFVIEVQDGQWLKRICFSVIDEERWQKMCVVEGGTYNVSFDIASHEYNGRYYTEANAWRAVRIDNGNAGQPAPAPIQTQSPAQPQPAPQQNNNDVPF